MIMNKKKVIILSGASYMIEAVQTAKNMGLYTIVADNAVQSPAKKYADKSYNSSTSDIGQLAEIAQKENVDGVFHAFDDINTWHAIALCKKMNLPFYTASEQLGSYPGNHRFKEYCQSFNVPVIEAGWYELDLATMEFSVRLPAEQTLQVV